MTIACQTPYDPDGASKRRTSITMDWTAEKASCVNILAKKPNHSSENEYGHVEVKDFSDVDDYMIWN